MLTDALAARKCRRLPNGLDREIASRGGNAEPRRLDHRCAGASDADVEVRPATLGDPERREDAADVAASPRLGPVSLVGRELRVEIAALGELLLGQLPGKDDRYAADEGERRTAASTEEIRLRAGEYAVTADADEVAVPHRCILDGGLQGLAAASVSHWT
ncbi:MAG TPA: hypothetical protein VK926_09950 [Gaiellaceae bacterium]|nr:hypothetical protein [Gaiellaceae bacterium]